MTDETKDVEADHVRGISSAHMADLRVVLNENDKRVIQLALECIYEVGKASYLLLTTVQELEQEAIDSLKSTFPFPVCPLGPTIPYFDLKSHYDHNLDHLKWLDSQPSESVLYISLGSFLSISSAEMDEIASALKISGVSFFWVARGEAFRLSEKCGNKGMVVPWCDQLRVLSHSSIGGFWSHCGWNSILEALFSGVPVLTFPLFLDQVPNMSQIVNEWKNGWKIERSEANFCEMFMRNEEISELVKRFMDLDSEEGRLIRDRARELKSVCVQAISKGGSSDANLDAFLQDIVR